MNGWESGKWSIIDQCGNVLVPPIFEDYDYACSRNYVAFYDVNKWDMEEPLVGVYDITNQKILFKPQFLDVDFLKNGNIKVEVFDEKEKKKVERIINSNGDIIIDGNYDSVFETTGGENFVFSKTIDGVRCYGLLDYNGEIIVECSPKYSFLSFDWNKKCIKTQVDEKYGIDSFDGKELVPPIYDRLHFLENDLIIYKYNGLEGLMDLIGNRLTEPIFYELKCCDWEENSFLANIDEQWVMLKMIFK